MKEFDDILKRKLNEQGIPPDSTAVWSKVNAGLSGNGSGRWKAIALLSLLLWLLAGTVWYFSSNAPKKDTKVSLNDTVQPTIITDTLIRIQTITDTIIHNVYITKWKEKPQITTLSDSIIFGRNADIEDPLKESLISANGFGTLPFLETQLPSFVKSSTFESKEKLRVQLVGKLIEQRQEVEGLPKFDFALWMAVPHYQEVVVQKSSTAPTLSSGFFTLSGNFRLLSGLSLHGGITRQKDNYAAAGITNAKNREIPDPGNPAYVLDEITVDQLLWIFNSGVSYDFLFKNKWIFSIGSGMDWILSGQQNNSYCFPGNDYLAKERIYEHLNSKFMTPQKLYLSLGLDLPIYRNWYLGFRVKKYYGLTQQSWLMPDFTSEAAIKYYFY